MKNVVRVMSNLFKKKFTLMNSTHLRYCVCKGKLGAGGSSTVKMYQCKNNCGNSHFTCDQIFVVKEYKPGLLYQNVFEKDVDKNEIASMLYHEYSVGKHLIHRYIIRTMDVDIQQNAIIFENFTSIDLLDFLNDYNLKDTSPLISYFSQVLEGVEYLHLHGVAHMDLKLENILIDTSQKQIKLIDFGQAYVFKSDGIVYGYNRISGTPEYMSPEMIDNVNKKVKKFLDAPKIDIWCLGVVLYNMTYNRSPWELANPRVNKKFQVFHAYMTNDVLHPIMFYDLVENFYTHDDNQVLQKMFKRSLDLDPQKRATITELRQICAQLRIVGDMGWIGSLRQRSNTV